MALRIKETKTATLHRPRRVFVTGGAGFIGSYTCRCLLKRDHHVTVFDPFILYRDDLSCPSIYANMCLRRQHLLANANVVRGATRNKHQTQRSLENVAPDVVIHFGGWPIASEQEMHSEEAFEDILVGTMNLLRSLPSTVERFVFVSSSMVYGDFHQEPMPEDGPTNPKGMYGAMKLAAEVLTKTFCQTKGITFSIVRPTAVYGPGDITRRVLQRFVEAALKGDCITAFNAAYTRLDFSYVTDVADGIAKVALSDYAANEEFNISFGEGRSLEEAIVILRELFPCLAVEYVTTDDERMPMRGALDVAKARRLIGYRPQISLE